MPCSVNIPERRETGGVDLGGGVLQEKALLEVEGGEVYCMREKKRFKRYKRRIFPPNTEEYIISLLFYSRKTENK